MKFQPFEDVMSVGHTGGIESLIVPGAGLGTPDAFHDNPYASTKERASALVKKMLEKLPADTIMLDPTQFGRRAVS